MPPHRPRVLSAFLGKLTRNLSLNRYKHHIAEKRGGGEAPAVLDEIAELVSDTDNVERAVAVSYTHLDVYKRQVVAVVLVVGIVYLLFRKNKYEDERLTIRSVDAAGRRAALK